MIIGTNLAWHLTEFLNFELPACDILTKARIVFVFEIQEKRTDLALIVPAHVTIVILQNNFFYGSGPFEQQIGRCDVIIIIEHIVSCGDNYYRTYEQ